MLGLLNSFNLRRQSVSTQSRAGKLRAKLTTVVQQLNVSDSTPLHHAVLSNNQSIVVAQLKAGANINAVDTHGRSSFALAMIVGNLEMAEYLIDQGADIRAGHSTLEFEPCLIAIDRNRHELYEPILAATRAHSDRDFMLREMLHYALNFGDNTKLLKRVLSEPIDFQFNSFPSQFDDFNAEYFKIADKLRKTNGERSLYQSVPLAPMWPRDIAFLHNRIQSFEKLITPYILKINILISHGVDFPIRFLEPNKGMLISFQKRFYRQIAAVLYQGASQEQSALNALPYRVIDHVASFLSTKHLSQQDKYKYSRRLAKYTETSSQRRFQENAYQQMRSDILYGRNESLIFSQKSQEAPKAPLMIEWYPEEKSKTKLKS